MQPRAISAVGIHTATVADVPSSADGRPVPSETVGKACRDYAQLNHYYTRSFEEFEAKRFRGSATGRIARPAIPFDAATVRVDTSALRFAQPTRAMIERMASLAPSPYRYGSELALTRFPRFNDLGLFSEFAIANTVMAEPTPRREPGLRLENRYPGIGFVGSIGAYDHEVRDGELSGSIHLAPLLERSRGRLEATLATATALPGGWRFDVEDHGQRRCYALGFVIAAGSSGRLTAELGRPDGSTSDPVDVKLEAGSTYAGVVELDASPDLASTLDVLLPAAEEGAVLFDLFVDLLWLTCRAACVVA